MFLSIEKLCYYISSLNSYRQTSTLTLNLVFRTTLIYSTNRNCEKQFRAKATQKWYLVKGSPKMFLIVIQEIKLRQVH